MGIKEKILKYIQSNGYVTKLLIAKTTGSTNGGEYISRLRKDHVIDCIMCTNANTGNLYGVYIYRGKK